MKKRFLLFLTLLIMGFNIQISHSFNNSNNPLTINYLINYSDSKIKDINKIIKKYNLEKNAELENKIKEIKNIKNILLETKRTGKYNIYINELILKLKNNNNSVKNYIKILIKNKKIKTQKYTILFSKKIEPIIKKINNIVIKIASKLILKNTINNKDRQIINILYQIKLKLNKLSNITNKTFNTKKELQNYIISNFNQIKFQFNQIKNIIKN